MNREDAERICRDLFMNDGKLELFFVKYMVCGSIRRLCDEIGDIDIVAIETNHGFGELTLSQKIHQLDPDGRKAAEGLGKQGGVRYLDGKAIKRFKYKNIMIDLYLATPATFETLVLIRTGSKYHNVRLTKLAMAKGMKLKAGGEGLVSRADESIIYQNTEQGILDTLLGHYPRPDQRN